MGWLIVSMWEAARLAAAAAVLAVKLAGAPVPVAEVVEPAPAAMAAPAAPETD